MLDILTSCVLIRIVENPVSNTKLIPKHRSFQEVLWIVLAVVGLYSSKQMDSQILPDFHRISLHPKVTILVEDSCLNFPDQLVKSFWTMFPKYLAKKIFIKTHYNFATKKNMSMFATQKIDQWRSSLSNLSKVWNFQTGTSKPFRGSRLWTWSTLQRKTHRKVKKI